MEEEASSPIGQFLNRYPAEVQSLALQTRALIREVMPETIEQLDPAANLIAFGTDRTYKGLVCGIVIFSTYINLMFADGAALPDPEGLLSGTGKRARHVKISSPRVLEAPGVRALLVAAIQARQPLESHQT